MQKVIALLRTRSDWNFSEISLMISRRKRHAGSSAKSGRNCGGNIGGSSFSEKQNKSYLSASYFLDMCLLDRTTLKIVTGHERPPKLDSRPVT
jgi:hypothetical protein